MPEPKSTALRLVSSTDTGGNDSGFDPRCGPTVDVERNLANLLANVVGADQVPADCHFFDNLGADSLLMAKFCARVRKRPDLPDVSMTDVYRYPPIRSLATALTGAAPAAVKKAGFQIPRSVDRDTNVQHLRRGEQRHLAAKNRHNIGTMALYLLVRWLYVIGILLLGSVTTLFSTQWEGHVAVALFGVVTALFTIFYWKVPAQTWIQLFNGTPFKGMVWRMLGVRVGRRLFDDGLTMTERTLVTIGDDCTLGVNAFIHCGTNVGDGAVIEAHSFLMKGEEIPPGNPATHHQDDRDMAGPAATVHADG